VRFQLLSDLHCETESFDPVPAPGAELLVLAGDIDSGWQALSRFRNWPVPVLMVAGNHEFDRREMSTAWDELRAHCDELGIRLIERESVVLTGGDGRRIRFVGTVRWCDFNLFGPAMQVKAQRAGTFFAHVMRATRYSLPFDAAAVREVALECRAWLASELAITEGDWERTVAITHFAPSLRSADPRYGSQPGTASFCNADDDLLPGADLWIHGHLHCRHDYVVAHERGQTRVVCNARGHSHRGEARGFDGELVLEV
jgi:DNA repair exonuclease SbcCD nuclease subunit